MPIAPLRPSSDKLHTDLSDPTFLPGSLFLGSTLQHEVSPGYKRLHNSKGVKEREPNLKLVTLRNPIYWLAGWRLLPLR